MFTISLLFNTLTCPCHHCICYPLTSYFQVWALNICQMRNRERIQGKPNTQQRSDLLSLPFFFFHKQRNSFPPDLLLLVPFSSSFSRSSRWLFFQLSNANSGVFVFSSTQHVKYCARPWNNFDGNGFCFSFFFSMSDINMFYSRRTKEIRKESELLSGKTKQKIMHNSMRNVWMLGISTSCKRGRPSIVSEEFVFFFSFVCALEKQDGWSIPSLGQSKKKEVLSPSNKKRSLLPPSMKEGWRSGDVDLWNKRTNPKKKFPTRDLLSSIESLHESTKSESEREKTTWKKARKKTKPEEPGDGDCGKATSPTSTTRTNHCRKSRSKKNKRSPGNFPSHRHEMFSKVRTSWEAGRRQCCICIFLSSTSPCVFAQNCLFLRSRLFIFLLYFSPSQLPNRVYGGWD